MKTLHHIKTGGTIVGCVPEYTEVGDLADIFSDTVSIDKFLTKSLKMDAGYRETEVCQKDSREVTDNDRSVMAAVILQEYEKGTRKFLVTHGTYTMPETGKYLIEHLPEEVLNDVQVIITGSMFPWTVLGSDAPINLGAAVGILLNTENTGVSICMHGKLFDPRKVEKDAENLIFHDTQVTT